MTGVLILYLVAVVGAVLAVGNLIGKEFEREARSWLGEADCSVWACTRPGVFAESDGSRRCHTHVGQELER